MLLAATVSTQNGSDLSHVSNSSDGTVTPHQSMKSLPHPNSRALVWNETQRHVGPRKVSPQALPRSKAPVQQSRARPEYAAWP